MSDIKNGDMPVTPLVMDNGHPYHASNVAFDNKPLTSGLSKREAFAMAAMQGLCANPSYISEEWVELITRESVRVADALLLELSKCQ